MMEPMPGLSVGQPGGGGRGGLRAEKPPGLRGVIPAELRAELPLGLGEVVPWGCAKKIRSLRVRAVGRTRTEGTGPHGPL